MKLALCVVSLSAMLLLPSGIYSSAKRTKGDPARRLFFRNAKNRHTVEYLLDRQQRNKVIQIIGSMKQCNRTWPVSEYDAQALFQNPPIIQMANESMKCLMSCMMRNQGVTTDDGFQVGNFMRTIMQLRLNYTSYNVNELSPDKKRNVLAAIARFSSTRKHYQVIETYEWASKECNLAFLIYDPNPNQCESSWNVASCIIEKSREKGFDLPLFPIFSIREVLGAFLCKTLPYNYFFQYFATPTLSTNGLRLTRNVPQLLVTPTYSSISLFYIVSFSSLSFRFVI